MTSAGTTSQPCRRWPARRDCRRGSTSPCSMRGGSWRPSHVRRVSYHNEMHGQHVAWQSILTRDHPQWLVTDRAGRERQEGVVSLAYPEARRAFIERWTSLIAPTEFDGLFVCLRSQSRPADTADQFGFNEPARRDFRERYGVDVSAGPVRHPGLARPARLVSDGAGERTANRARTHRQAACRSDAHVATCWARRSATRRCRGATGYATTLSIVSSSIRARRSARRCGISCGRCIEARATCRTIWTEPGCRHWPTICPRRMRPRWRAAPWSCSWRGSGASPRARMTPACRAIPGVTGLVFGSFRFDNPDAVKRGDWRAGSDGRRVRLQADDVGHREERGHAADDVAVEGRLFGSRVWHPGYSERPAPRFPRPKRIDCLRRLISWWSERARPDSRRRSSRPGRRRIFGCGASMARDASARRSSSAAARAATSPIARSPSATSGEARRASCATCCGRFRPRVPPPSSRSSVFGCTKKKTASCFRIPIARARCSTRCWPRRRGSASPSRPSIA